MNLAVPLTTKSAVFAGLKVGQLPVSVETVAFVMRKW
jgi:hypothetical protein